MDSVTAPTDKAREETGETVDLSAWEAQHDGLRLPGDDGESGTASARRPRRREGEMPKCYVCGKDVMTVALHRVNPLGELPAVWACEPHHPAPAALDPETLHLTDIISGANRRTN